ncbi:MAG: hypothetical protein ABSB35_04800 [Bryobacteraceae bacterium]|jgi:hypothetical protein
MKIYLVSYATGRFVPEQACLMTSGARFGATDLRPWTEEMLHDTPFYSERKTILDMRRGAGYWLWKPFIIVQTLEEMQEGDCLIYSDSGIEIVADLTPLLKIAVEKRGVMLFSGTGKCREWTKRDCFVYMNADHPAAHEAQMLDASFVVLTKTPLACAFAAEWFESCRDRRILTDEPNTCGLPNLPGFVDHRHDQSVLSLLARRENSELFRHPSQFGNHAKMPEYRERGEWTIVPYASEPSRNSPYGTLLNHHRGLTPVHVRRAAEVGRRSIWSRLIRPSGRP